MTCDDTSQAAAQVVASSESIEKVPQRYVLASSMKLCIPSLTISFFPLLALVGLALLLLLLDSKQHRLNPRPFNFDTKDIHRLVLCVQTTRKSSQVERNLR